MATGIHEVLAEHQPLNSVQCWTSSGIKTSPARAIRHLRRRLRKAPRAGGSPKAPEISDRVFLLIKPVAPSGGARTRVGRSGGVGRLQEGQAGTQGQAEWPGAWRHEVRRKGKDQYRNIQVKKVGNLSQRGSCSQHIHNRPK